MNDEKKRADYFRALLTESRRLGRKQEKAHTKEVTALRDEIEKLRTGYEQAARAAIEAQKKLELIKGIINA